MGEYAIDQMMLDYRRLTGVDANRGDFEDEVRPAAKRPLCPKCGKKFRVPLAVRDHLRDKHGIVTDGPAMAPRSDPGLD